MADLIDTDDEILEFTVEELLEELSKEFSIPLERLKPFWQILIRMKGRGQPPAICNNIIADIQKVEQCRDEYLDLLKAAEGNPDLRRLNLRKIVDYVKNYSGSIRNKNTTYLPYLAALASLGQNFCMNRISICTPKFQTTGVYHLLNIGEPQSGKSFNTAKFLKGSREEGIPPHGIPYILCGTESMMAPAFVQTLWVLETSSDIGFIYTNNEITGWLTQTGMVNQLKLALENSVVAWKLKNKESIPEFRVKGTFNLCANENYDGTRNLRNADSDVNALQSRCITFAWPLTKEISDYILRREMRYDSEAASDIRQFMVWLHNLTRNKEIEVVWSEEQYGELMSLRDYYLELLRKKCGLGEDENYSVKIGVREVRHAVKFASNLALMNYFELGEPEQIPIGELELELAKELLWQMMQARQKEIVRVKRPYLLEMPTKGLAEEA